MGNWLKPIWYVYICVFKIKLKKKGHCGGQNNGPQIGSCLSRRNLWLSDLVRPKGLSTCDGAEGLKIICVLLRSSQGPSREGRRRVRDTEREDVRAEAESGRREHVLLTLKMYEGARIQAPAAAGKTEEWIFPGGSRRNPARGPISGFSQQNWGMINVCCFYFFLQNSNVIFF